MADGAAQVVETTDENQNTNAGNDGANGGLTDNDVKNLESILRTGRPASPPSTTQQQGNQGGTGAAAAQQQQQQQNAGGAAAAKDKPVDYTEFLKKHGFENEDGFVQHLTKAKDLEAQVNQLSEYKAGPKFKSERAKFLYDFANSVEGMEPRRARQLLELSELDLKNTPDQRIRFESFKLKPENQSLSQEEIADLFHAEELEKYGNPADEQNPQTNIQKIRAKQATDLARADVSKVLDDWNKTRPVEKTAAELAQEKIEYTQFINKQLEGFENLPPISLMATNEAGEKTEGTFNFKLDKEKQLPAIIDALRDPQGWWDKKLEQHGIMTADSKMPDMKKWGALVARIEFMEDFFHQIYQQGQSDNHANQLKTKRNLSNPGGNGGTGGIQDLTDEQKAGTLTKESVNALKTVGILK